MLWQPVRGAPTRIKVVVGGYGLVENRASGCQPICSHGAVAAAVMDCAGQRIAQAGPS